MNGTESQWEMASRELRAIRGEMIESEVTAQGRLAEIDPHFRESARNLLHYLVLRKRDLRPLQTRLASLGLSSLGRAESQVLSNVDAVLEVLEHPAGTPISRMSPDEASARFARGAKRLDENAFLLLGAADRNRRVRVMVTMPGEAADDYQLVHDLLERGMDCMRINCAHDDATAWARMIEHLRRAEQALNRSCKIAMDLAGPKLRTGPLESGPRVLKIRPKRDVIGQVKSPARFWLYPDGDPQPSLLHPAVPVSRDWLSQLRVGERIKFIDARGARRPFQIIEIAAEGCWAEMVKTAYFVPGLDLKRRRRECNGSERKGVVGNLPSTENAIRLQPGDMLVVSRNVSPGHLAVVNRDGQAIRPPTIGCTIPEVFDDARPGEAIWFDDGKIGGTIEAIEAEQVLVRITRARQGQSKLRADKGINLPDSDLKLPAMTPKDVNDLAFIAQHADIVELSFANTRKDVETLHGHFERLGGRAPAIVLKIETRRAFENLPDMLLAAMRKPICGVMIARGDLAVECGFERLAEVQEEMLWICEAAHVPVIWATQVLESLAKEGMPSRAEITDASMGDDAECVMLNKGPHILSAVGVLDDILRRMQSHHVKKRAMLRELRLAHKLVEISKPSAEQT